jgi:thiamine-phosphate pyrophosphorylase
MIESAHVPASGLYAITPDRWPSGKLLAAVEQALAGGVSLVQYRAKPRPDKGIALELLERCRRHDAWLIINDDATLAAHIGADGVHLGRDDDDIALAREALGPNALIGASCYNDLERARRLAEAGADYLAFGSVFASPTKPDAVHCSLDVITRAAAFEKPIAAIGGITLANAAQVFEAGARWVAVISDLFEAEDITQRARDYQELIEP